MRCVIASRRGRSCWKAHIVDLFLEKTLIAKLVNFLLKTYRFKYTHVKAQSIDKNRPNQGIIRKTHQHDIRKKLSYYVKVLCGLYYVMY
jgi:hypothetical protein